MNNIRLERLLKKANFDLVSFGRNEYLSIGSIYEIEEKFKEALVSYIRVLYIDLSGVSAYNAWTKFPDERDFKNDIQYSGISFAPGIISYIVDLKDYYSDDVIDMACNPKLPIEACSKNMLKDIVQLAFSGKLMECKETRERIKDALNSNFLNIGKSWTPKMNSMTYHEQSSNSGAFANIDSKTKKNPVDYEQKTDRVSSYRKEEKIKEESRYGWELIKEFAYKDGDTRVTYRRNKLSPFYSVWNTNRDIMKVLYSVVSEIKSTVSAVGRSEKKFTITERIFNNRLYKEKKEAYSLFLIEINNDKELITKYYENWCNALEVDNTQIVPSTNDLSELLNKYAIKVVNGKTSCPKSFKIEYADDRYVFVFDK